VRPCPGHHLLKFNNFVIRTDRLRIQDTACHTYGIVCEQRLVFSCGVCYQMEVIEGIGLAFRMLAPL
jgi:hypothetical protein